MKITLILLSLLIVCLGLVVFGYTKMTAQTGYQELIEQKLPEANKITNPAELSGWVAWWNDSEAITTLDIQNQRLNTVLPLWYTLSKDGQIQSDPRYQNKVTLKKQADSKGIKVMPTITNEFDPDKTSAFLDNWDYQQEAIENLTQEAKTEGFIGYDIDWEEVYEGDKKGFSEFVYEFSERLHQEGLKLSVTVHPKTGQELIDSQGSKSQNWDEIGLSADYIRIMIYDYHHENSAPGPITPLDYYQSVINYALTSLPKEKIIIGLPTYGYDWSDKGIPLQYNEVLEKIETYKAKTQRDKASSELKFIYKEAGKKHEVWFEDSESAQVKITLAKSYGINKFTFWRLGGEDSKIWSIK